MYTFLELDPYLQDRITDPSFVLEIKQILEEVGITDEAVISYVEDVCTQAVNNSISLSDLFQKMASLFKEEKIDDEVVGTYIIRILTPEGLEIIAKYDTNKPTDSKTEIQQKTSPISQSKKIELEDNRTLYTRLFDALEPFNLHVDEQSVIATEVEKYIQGETSAKDVNAYIAAHLDKPISEVGKIIESLNSHIFVPLKKTLVEEKVLDIHDSDDALTEALLGKRAKKTGPLSFIPSDLEHSIEKRKKDEIVKDLQSVGGTPGGASLLSQEIKDEQDEKAIEKKMNISIMPKKSYTVDPYREVL